MKFFKKNARMQQADANQARRFTLGQYIAAVTALLLSVTAISYAAGILKLNTFTDGLVISSKSVNDNFDYVQTNLDVIAASMVSAASSVQASVATINTSINSINGQLSTITTAVSNIQSMATYVTSQVTPIPVLGTILNVVHGAGATPKAAQLEFICLTAEQGYSIGDVVSVSSSWNGASVQFVPTSFNSTNVFAPIPSSYDYMLINRTAAGTNFTPTKANWAYRFVIWK